MSSLRSLAGQTAVYGVSSILGRLLNYALVPLHTSIFPNTQDLGVVTGLYAYTAILMVIYTFGMETAFFRFATKSKDNSIFQATVTSILIISTLFSGLIILNASNIAVWANYPGTETYIIWIAIILWIDSVLAVPFAQLRLANKAKFFAFAKVSNIVINVLLQLFFLVGIPFMTSRQLPGAEIVSNIPQLGIGFIFLANLIANSLLIIFLWKWIMKIRLIFQWQSFKPILWYAFPIMLTGLAGMINEQLDKILLEKILQDNFYSTMDSTAALGVYGQTFKLSIFMMLAIQAFRYAGEPFFFKSAEDKNAPELFARIMHYFVILSLLIFVLVSINVDLIALIFLRNESYRVALYLVPILLFGKLFYGIYTNLSIWFKLTDKTIYGTYISVVGAIVTVVANLILIPIIGFTGCAIACVLCYITMCIVCYNAGKKHYPIPYNFRRLMPYFIVSVLLVVTSVLFKLENPKLDMLVKLSLSLVIILSVYLIEKPSLTKKTA